MDALILRDADETARFGRALACAMLETGPFALLMTGPLGCGKTTLSSALVRALPGGDMAEVSSPSFTLCNLYPTSPRVLHCDLYRNGRAALPDDIAEALDDGATAVLVEWAELLDSADVPEEYIGLSFEQVDPSGKGERGGRRLALSSHGLRAGEALAIALDAMGEDPSA